MSIVIRRGDPVPSRSHEYDIYPPFGMFHAADPRGRKWYEPQRTTDFEFVMVGLEDMESVTGEKNPAGAGEILRYAVESASFPHYSVGVQEDKRGNSVQKFAGVASWEAGKLVVKDWIGADTKSILLTWLHQAYDVYTDKTGLLDDYKRDCTLIEYTPDRQIVRSWTMFGCWVSDVSEEDWQHTNENALRTITATIQFDKAVLDRGTVGSSMQFTGEQPWEA